MLSCLGTASAQEQFQQQQQQQLQSQPPYEPDERNDQQSFGNDSSAQFSAPQYGNTPDYYSYQQNFCRPPAGWLYPQQQSATLPSGLTLPISLDTSISTQAAKEGDYIQAHINHNITLGGPNYLPGGTVVTGEVTASKPGRRAERSGLLTIQFNQLRLPNGLLIPIQAHLVGDIGNYKLNGNDTVRGEGLGTKILNFGLRTGLGAGMGTAFGCAIGGISQGRYGVGSGAWSGMAIGSGAGALYSLLGRRGRDVLIHAGTQMQLQVDEPVQIPGPSAGRGPGYPQQGVF